MHKNIRLFALFNFFTDFRLYSAILIIYFAKVTGSYALGMSLFSVTMVCSALFEIPTGIFSDYIGRKKTMVLGVVCSVLSVTFYALGANYLILFIGALFEGCKEPGIAVTIMLYFTKHSLTRIERMIMTIT